MGKLQTILRRKVLDYHGTKVLKDWASAKQFVGKKVRVTIGHPKVNLITKKFEKGKEVATVTIKTCPTSGALCANIPNHGFKGYSIGYGFKQTDEKGEHDGQPYDAKRYLNNIDHIALVDDPRDPELLADSLSFAVDSFTDGKIYVNIYPELEVGIDSYFFPVELGSDTDVIYMGDDNPISDIAKLRADMEIMKQQMAKDQKENKSLKDKLKNSILTEVKNDMDRLENLHNFNPEVFKGKKADFIKGALFAADSLKEEYGHASADELDDDSQETDESGYDISIHDVEIDENGNLTFGN